MAPCFSRIVKLLRTTTCKELIPTERPHNVFYLALLHSGRPKLYTMLAFLGAVGLNKKNLCQ